MVHGVGQTAILKSVFSGFRAGSSSPNLVSGNTENNVSPLFSQDPPEFNAGFGDGTVNSAAAAFRALDHGMVAARTFVPTVESIRAQQQQRREAQQEAAPKIGYGQREKRRLDIAAGSRKFINRLNDVATNTEARLNGEQSPREGDGPTIRVNGEIIPMRQTGNTPLIDVLA